MFLAQPLCNRYSIGIMCEIQPKNYFLAFCLALRPPKEPKIRIINPNQELAPRGQIIISVREAPCFFFLSKSELAANICFPKTTAARSPLPLPRTFLS